MKKQRSIDRIKELQAENHGLREKLAAGERRRRAAVEEISFLNRKLSAILADRSAILANHQATVIRMAKKFGAQVGENAWELTYQAADPADLLAHKIEASMGEDGVLTVRVSEDLEEDPEDGENGGEHRRDQAVELPGRPGGAQAAPHLRPAGGDGCASHAHGNTALATARSGGERRRWRHPIPGRGSRKTSAWRTWWPSMSRWEAG